MSSSAQDGRRSSPLGLGLRGDSGFEDSPDSAAPATETHDKTGFTPARASRTPVRAPVRRPPRRSTQVLREEPGDLPLIIHLDDDGAFPSRTVYGEDIAPLPARAVATVVDLVVLAVVNVIVAWGTLQAVGLPLTLERLRELRGAPIVAFYVTLALVYVTGLTLYGGQTLGKRLTGIRVVDDQGDDLSFAQALFRAIAWLASVASLGLLCLPALFDVWSRTVHDRLSGTHVVYARQPVGR